ncbi:hypothetical protein IBE20_04495 [Francisella tularensis subsp. novicida]|nr:hypothetical protein [Francisella tularensis]AJI60933.1 hypothetical protein AW25_159 [Francisella tularensis subsp. novicida U112]EDX19345.1 hypothetical protein FTE_0333 [Francisella tularensis subsp. novicida FTE]MBK2036008.1 hypothetical protein [Francisella tularensis subsp. novicida]MBK2115934.1 hypothetical protein [Francisella tularensis subsp. novicida]MBK2311909.1 hypothetical protein [Francisella tularensis subsp. novicida]
MSKKDDIDNLIVLNAIKEISQDKLIDLLYSEKFNDIFQQHAILRRMLPKSELLSDSLSLTQRWFDSLVENILPNTYPSLLSQSIRLMIIPFDENLNLNPDKSVEVNSYYIQNLDISLMTNGFNGTIEFVYPYQSEYSSKLMEIFTQGLPFQVEIYIKQEFFIEDDEKVFIEKNGDLSNQEIKFIAYAGNHQTKETLIRSPRFDNDDFSLVNFDGLYKIDFCDSMSFFWKQLNPVSIYSGESYRNIFEDQNTPFDKLVKLNFDTSSDDALKQKLAFICMNCDCNASIDGFYGYFNYILQSYNLILIYDYMTNEYLITSSLKDLVSNAKPVKSIFLADKQKIQEIKHIHKKPFIGNKSIINTNLNCTDKQQIEISEIGDLPKTIKLFKQDTVTEHDLSVLFNLKKNNYETKIQNTFASNNVGLEINSKSIPCSFSILPLQNSLCFSSNEWGLIFDKKDKNMVLHKAELKFEKTPLYTKNNKRHPLAYEDKQQGNIVEEKISFEFENNALKNSELPLMFNCNSKLYLYNDELWPEYNKYQKPKPLYVCGEIFTTKSDDENSTYTSELFNYSSDSSTSIAANDNYSSSSKNYCLDPNATSRPRYQVRVSPYLWTKLTPNTKQLVPADMTLSSYSNLLFYFKSGTKVELCLFEEYANITKIKNYLVPEDMFVSGDKEQHQAIVFENRKEQNTVIQNSYKLGDKTSSFKIIHSPNDSGSPSSLEIDNTSFKISVDCKK